MFVPDFKEREQRYFVESNIKTSQTHGAFIRFLEIGKLGSIPKINILCLIAIWVY